MRGQDCVPVKLHSQKQALGRAVGLVRRHPLWEGCHAVPGDGGAKLGQGNHVAVPTARSVHGPTEAPGGARRERTRGRRRKLGILQGVS